MSLFAKPMYLLLALFALGLLGMMLWLGATLIRHYTRALFGQRAYMQLTAPLRKVSRWKNALLLASVAFVFIALAGPQWGIEITEAQGNFAQTVIAVDVSASMRAQDVKPTRLSNAKRMLQMLVTHLKEDRLGIIAFTSKAFIQCPITTDTDALNYFISSLQPNMLPVAGTSLAAPVELAAHMLKTYPGQKALILLTDGEDHTPQELTQAQTLAQQNGIRIIAVGIGSTEGALIPDQIDANGNVVEYKKDKSGKTVVSKLDETSLAQLAQATGGAYIAYTTPAQVAARIEQAVAGLDKSTSSTGRHTTYKNRYALPLCLALLCLVGYLLWPQRAQKR
ncbi:MAG: VWA domain-containing protein [Elusimicrobiaceae bacterium]|nr:VWA domain-containing protein [Elusimicrobiaceae bacterium]